MEKCPECGKVYAKYPLFKNIDGKKKPILKNWFFPDPAWLLVVLAVIMILYGFIDITEQCNDAIYDPCAFCDKTGCCIIPANNNYFPMIDDIKVDDRFLNESGLG